MDHTKLYDVAIIGAGIAGTGLGAMMDNPEGALIIEAESQPGFHSTGRSAAIFARNLGNDIVRRLTRDSAEFLSGPPDEWGASSFITPQDILWLADDPTGEAALESELAQDTVEEISVERAKAMFPLLREDRVRRCALETGTGALDVHGVHQTYQNRFRARGGERLLDARVTELGRENGSWWIQAGPHRINARVVVNAAGAWADRIAAMAGIPTVGLQPKRRSVALLPPPEGESMTGWPVIVDAAFRWYAKPETGRILVSPCDEDPVDPQDIHPDDMVIAEGLDRFETATGYPLRRVLRSWAGLRSFVSDETPVVGHDPDHEGFFWLAGQGGFGIQTSPALSRTAAELLAGRAIDRDLAGALSPARFR